MDIIRIAFIIKTESLDYDDRVRKEILTVQKLYPYIKFKIFVMLSDNIESEGETSYGIPFKSVYIKSRYKYRSTERIYLKAYEFHKTINYNIKNYDVVWCADVETSIIALLARNKNIIWDLHELPAVFMSNYLSKLFLRILFRKCKLVLHANQQRIDYLKRAKIINDTSKHIAVRNFPNFDDVDDIYDDLYYKFTNWKEDKKCVYLQGLNNDGRAAYESIVAVLQEPKLVAVIVGGFDMSIKERLINEFGVEVLKDRLFFTGKISQLKTPQYIKQCFMSLVFYKNTSPNNFYCEANRFYQAVIMGLPVLVGNNPTMKDLVEKYNFGLSIDDDGSNISVISDGIKTLMKNYEFFLQNNERYREELLWEKQEPVVRQIVDRIVMKANY